MRACGGTWVAHGSGDADRAVERRPSGAWWCLPTTRHTHLRRVWLTKEEEQGYYYGFANEGCGRCATSPTRGRSFDRDDWEQYRRVNRKFADAVLEEVDGEPAVVFVQDYHFALLPRMLKHRAARPRRRAVLAHPVAQPRGVPRLPVAGGILDGLLGNDLLSFHIQYHCNNFLDTVDRGSSRASTWSDSP